MSLSELKKLVPPPTTPQDVGSLSEWENFEGQLGLKLPREYREFIFSYGSGQFAAFYAVFNPFSSNRHINLLKRVEEICRFSRQLQAECPERFPFPYYPENGGLLPWGSDENGNYYFWLTQGPPSKWVVVQDEVRGYGIENHAVSLTEFLIAILRGEIKPLVSEYPDQAHFKFEPWNV